MARSTTASHGSPAATSTMAPLHAVRVDGDARGRHPDDGPVKAVVGDEQVGATAHDEQGLAGGVRRADHVDQLGLARRLDEASGRAAEAERRQLGEAHAAQPTIRQAEADGGSGAGHHLGALGGRHEVDQGGAGLARRRR